MKQIESNRDDHECFFTISTGAFLLSRVRRDTNERDAYAEISAIVPPQMFLVLSVLLFVLTKETYDFHFLV